ncbi:hypothetical protein SAMN05661096_04103 [Marivirga sericea]|uniref:Uncharacterized protein n=2 Tax=Marivirga sericea TaxID=1028 RepID=A0A1X7LJ14_9BACT|nr:hypothetical protein SAMN05661096_04103 [Marivirga sericea]
MAVVIYFLICGINFNLTVFLIDLGAVILLMIITDSNYFDGIRISQNSMIISKYGLLTGFSEYNLKFEDISKLIYKKGNRGTPTHIVINTKRKPSTLRVSIKADIFKFAYILRELRNRGLTTQLSSSDYEIELFLKGKIQDLPMRNDMEIR